MNKNEFGQTIRANFGEDVSLANSFKMILEPEQGILVEKNAILGTVNIVDGDQDFLANEYVEYTIEAEVLNRSGQWRKRGKATFSNKETLGNFARFTVLD